jgi:hypothetical protein
MRKKGRRGFLTQITAVVLTPVIVLVVLYISTMIAGTATAPGCAPWRIARLAAFGSGAPEVVCLSVPLVADIPSWTLAITSSIAFALYLALAKRLRHIIDDLVASGLLDGREIFRDPLRPHMRKIRGALTVSTAKQLLLFLPVLGAGIAFYVFMNSRNHLFNDLPSIQGAADPAALETTYQASWWASWDQHPAAGVAWVLIGSIGAYYAIKQGTLSWRLSKFFVAGARLAVLNYVPSRRDRDHGWAPVGRVIVLAYISALNFLISFIALLYMLNDSQSGMMIDILLATLAVGGAAINIRFVYSMIRCVRRAYMVTVDVQLADVNRKIAEQQRRNVVDVAAVESLEVRGERLATAQPYPIRGRAIRLLSLAPGLIAVTKLTYDAVHLVAK